MGENCWEVGTTLDRPTTDEYGPIDLYDPFAGGTTDQSET